MLLSSHGGFVAGIERSEIQRELPVRTPLLERRSWVSLALDPGYI
jgi:hypothetical protein